MKKLLMIAALTAASLSASAVAQNASLEEAEKPHPSPNEIVAKAKAEEWVAIKASDLLVINLAKDRDGKDRRVVIQLMPAPFSQGWVRNIRKLAQSGYWDGTAVIRVQDNYVVQWGDADADDKEKAKKLPVSLELMPESAYVNKTTPEFEKYLFKQIQRSVDWQGGRHKIPPLRKLKSKYHQLSRDILGRKLFLEGWPFSLGNDNTYASTHCYGMVGVGRGMPPNTGDGSSLYTVIGHAPRHLDRNIALVGRVIEGIEYLSSLPRGTGPLGFYEKAEERTAITSVRLASELEERPAIQFEYLSTDSESFAKYADARANRRDPFFIKPAGGADICNIPVPIRRKK